MFLDIEAKTSLRLPSRFEAMHKFCVDIRPDFLVPYLRAILCKNQTKWETKNFEPLTQIYMEVGPHEECSKMSLIEVIT